MSALLTTTMPYMKVVIDTLKAEGPARQVHRAGRRRAAQRGIRQGRRRRRLLPRRGVAVETAKTLIAARRAARPRRTDGAMDAPARILVIACGALAREIVALRRERLVSTLDVQCLPPELHNRPERIPGAVRETIRAHARRTTRKSSSPTPTAARGGELDEVLQRGRRRAHRRRALLRVLRDVCGLRRAERKRSPARST